MKRIYSTLQSLVKKEAAKLKQFATPEELANLNFNKLEVEDPRYCIYGQITGNCYSDRANQLIVECAERVYNTPDGLDNEETIYELNGAPKNIAGIRSRRTIYHSPIELFIVLNYEGCEDNLTPENNKILIDYLKGETNILQFKTQ